MSVSRLFGLLLGMLLVALFAPTARADQVEDGKALFEEHCSACHTVGEGPSVGPDLLGVVQKRDRAWLRRAILDPEGLLKEKDPIMVGLLEEFDGMEMPNSDLSDADTEAIIAWLEAAQPAAAAAPTPEPSPSPPPPAGNAATGEALFMGTVPFSAGGPACVACHHAPGAGMLGGGSLATDLTDLHSRLGPDRLASALKGLPFPVMRDAYQGRALTTSEQADLAAFFAHLAGEPRGTPSVSPGAVLWAAGFLGAGLLFGLLALPWMGRRPSISEQLRRQA